MPAGAGASVGTLAYQISADTTKLRRDVEIAKKQIKSSTDKMARDVRRGANKIEKSANDIGYAFNKIRRASQVVASAFIIQALVARLGRFAMSVEKAQESVDMMEARFKEFGQSGVDSFSSVYHLSQRLGVSLESTATGMTRLLIATKKLGTSQAELERIQENIIILGRAGGTSAEEMKGALIQLSQGMASGRLQGEELRSVLENLPLVAMEIADELDTDIGKIREFAAEGKITTAVIVRALEEIGIKLEDLPRTLSQSTARMKTEWTLLLAHMGRQVDSEAWIDELAFIIKDWREAMGDTTTLQRPQSILESEIRDTEKKIELLERRASGLQLFDSQKEIIDPKSAQQAEEWLAVYKQKLVDLQNELVGVSRAAVRGAVLSEIDVSGFPEMKGMGTPEGYQSFVKQFQTAEQKVASLRSQLEYFKEYIIAEFGEDEFNRMAQDITAFLDEGIEEINTNRIMAMKRYLEPAVDEMTVYAEQAARNIQDAFADFLFDPFDKGLKSMLQGFIDVMRRMIAEAGSSFILQTLFAGTPIGALFGKRAMGGPVAAGGTYLVGEEGPELLRMGSSSGVVVPNHKLQSGGVTVVQNNNIDARGATQDVIQMLPGILAQNREAAVNEVRDLVRRGSL